MRLDNGPASLPGASRATAAGRFDAVGSAGPPHIAHICVLELPTVLDFAVAYIDPGSGSLIIQVIIASILAVPYFLRTQIGRAINTVRGRGKADEQVAPAAQDAPPPEAG